MTKSTLRSMTGFSSTSRDIPNATLNLELRGVNSRFLDVQFRMPEELRHAEPGLRELLTQQIGRGKVECRLNLNRKEQQDTQLALNPQVLRQLAHLQTQLHALMPQAEPLRSGEILHWPGVVQDSSLTAEQMAAHIQAMAQDAVMQFQNTRQREGDKLKAILLERVQAMEAITARLAPLLPQIVAAHQQKLTERMLEALGVAAAQGGASLSLSEAAERIRQEVTLFGIRIDVAEELGRLAAHLAETRHILDAGGQTGKRLDFMMQELNREANTLGSKAVVKELADASMELKLLIEQMREQVQNLE